MLAIPRCSTTSKSKLTSTIQDFTKYVGSYQKVPLPLYIVNFCIVQGHFALEVVEQQGRYQQLGTEGFDTMHNNVLSKLMLTNYILPNIKICIISI